MSTYNKELEERVLNFVKKASPYLDYIMSQDRLFAEMSKSASSQAGRPVPAGISKSAKTSGLVEAARDAKGLMSSIGEMFTGNGGRIEDALMMNTPEFREAGKKYSLLADLVNNSGIKQKVLENRLAKLADKYGDFIGDGKHFDTAHILDLAKAKQLALTDPKAAEEMTKKIGEALEAQANAYRDAKTYLKSGDLLKDIESNSRAGIVGTSAIGGTGLLGGGLGYGLSKSSSAGMAKKAAPAPNTLEAALEAKGLMSTIGSWLTGTRGRINDALVVNSPEFREASDRFGVLMNKVQLGGMPQKALDNSLAKLTEKYGDLIGDGQFLDSGLLYDMLKAQKLDPKAADALMNKWHEPLMQRSQRAQQAIDYLKSGELLDDIKTNSTVGTATVAGLGGTGAIGGTIAAMNKKAGIGSGAVSTEYIKDRVLADMAVLGGLEKKSHKLMKPLYQSSKDILSRVGSIFHKPSVSAQNAENAYKEIAKLEGEYNNALSNSKYNEVLEALKKSFSQGRGKNSETYTITSKNAKRLNDAIAKLYPGGEGGAVAPEAVTKLQNTITTLLNGGAKHEMNAAGYNDLLKTLDPRTFNAEVAAAHNAFTQGSKKLTKDMVRSYGQDLAAMRAKGMAAVGTAGAGLTAGALGAGIGHTTGHTAGMEDYQNTVLPGKMMQAASTGHDVASAQANNASFLDRLGYLFTGSNSSLGMNNPMAGMAGMYGGTNA